MVDIHLLVNPWLNCSTMVGLTVNFSRPQLSVDHLKTRDTVQNVEQGLGQPEEIAKVVESKVNQIPEKQNE